MDNLINYTSYLIAIGCILFFVIDSLEKLEKAISKIDTSQIPVDNVSITDNGEGYKSLVIPFNSLYKFFRLWRDKRFLGQGKYFSKIIIALILILFSLQILSDLFSNIISLFAQLSLLLKFFIHLIAAIFLIIWSFLYRLSKKYLANSVVA